MELLQAISERRATRRYLPKPVDAPTIRELLRCAVKAPSALNQQPWAFAVFQGRDRLAGYSLEAKEHLLRTLPARWEAHPRSELYGNPEYDMFHGAGTLIVVCAKAEGLNPNEDCCLAAENLMLAAHGAGLATCPIGFARSWLNLPEVKARLGIPPEYAAVFPLVIGYRDGAAVPTPRQEPEIVSWMEERRRGP